MEIQVQEKEGNLICLRHHEKITMFIMDSKVPFKDTLLCQKCFEIRDTICTKNIHISQALQLIGEQRNKNPNQKTQSIVDDLRSLINKLMEYKDQVIYSIDSILSRIDQWIKDLNQVNNFANQSLLQQLQQLHQAANDPQNNQQLIAKEIYSNQNKLIAGFKSLYNLQELKNCHQQLQKLLDNQQIKNISQIIPKEYQLAQVPKKCEQINVVKQEQVCCALAFNKTGSIIVTGCCNDIKVWRFDNGQMTELTRLTGHTDQVTCLVFSKKLEWFVSGGDDKQIRGWKEYQNNNWIATSPQQEHTNWIYCLLLNSIENELISCSEDKTVKVWKVDCSNNKISFNYSLENKHQGAVVSLSLNLMETALVSSDNDKTIILWMKGSNNKWKFMSQIKQQYGSRLCFISDTQFLFQPREGNTTKIFKIENKLIIEEVNQQINQKEANQDDQCFFPTIYNKKRQIVIQKYNKNVYVMKKESDGSLNIALDPIYCETICNFGTLTEDGDFLGIWNSQTKELRIYQLIY